MVFRRQRLAMGHLLAVLDTSTLGLFDFDCTLLGTALTLLLGEFIYGKVVLISKASFTRNQSFVRTLMFTPYNRSLLALRDGWNEISAFVASKFRYGLKAILVHASLSSQALRLLGEQSFSSHLFLSSAVDLEVKNS